MRTMGHYWTRFLRDEASQGFNPSSSSHSWIFIRNLAWSFLEPYRGVTIRFCGQVIFSLTAPLATNRSDSRERGYSAAQGQQAAIVEH